MKLLVLVALTAVFTFCSAAETEESFSDLEGSAASKEFTPAERKYFTEALDRYKKYELHDDFNIRSNIAWLDNDHIVFSARKLPGWEAVGVEHSRIIAMNVVTGKYKDTGYRGRLMCLNHLGDMMVRRGGDEIIPNLMTVNYEWLVGRWGEPLRTIEKKLATFVPNYLCKFSPYGDPIYTTPHEKITTDMHRILPLLQEHGYFKESVKFTENQKIHLVHFFKADGSTNFVSNKIPSHGNFYFAPWMNAYFEPSPIGYEPRIFHPSGYFTPLPTPKLLEYWTNRSPAMVATGTPTKAGVLWDVHQDFGYWKKQGLYLSTSERLLRVDRGRGSGQLVSPNGCKVLDTVTRDDPFSKISNNNILLIIDLCKENK
jgi:hypothetical protein